MHTYRKSRGDDNLWTVGYWIQDEGKPIWEPLSDHRGAHEAMERVNFLNGGNRRVDVEMIER